MPLIARSALSTHRARQAEERLRVGAEWRDSGLVFTTGIGTPVEPRALNSDFARMLERAGLDHARLHDLRHSAASFLLAQGVHPRVVMEILGHSQISLTMNTYSHVLPSGMREAADKMDAVLAGA
ncbi:MAG TPA: site-specific integrase [Candidatus Binataceae bacterium]